MIRFFDLILAMYPSKYRAEFAGEMRDVFLELARSRRAAPWPAMAYFACKEYFGLLRGAIYERCRQIFELSQFWWTATSVIGGAVLSFGLQLLMYWSLLPGRSRHLSRVLESFASRIFVVCLLAGMAFGQPPAKQDLATLELTREIYAHAFTDLREAKTMEDMKKLSSNLDSPDWISVDRFGRTVLTRQEAEGDLKSLLSLPPERRVTEMDIVWAERDSDRLMVLAWMTPNEMERVDAEGEYGPKGTRHKLMRGTLVRDIFLNTSEGWRRIRHDKLTPNSTVLAVDGAPLVLPPLDERHRVTARPPRP